MQLWQFGRFVAVWCAIALGSIATARAETIVLYTSVDQPIAQKVIDHFQQKTGHTVRMVTDTEASRSVGIAERLRAERDRPRAQVWWGNEVFYTIGLAEDGLFDPLDDSPALQAIDPRWVDPQKRYAGVGLRLRVLGTRGGEQALTLEELAGPPYRNQVVLARPTAGTTGGHVAAIYVLWGDARADAFFKGLHANGAVLVGGNSVAAQQVAVGNFRICLTDNDDVAAVNDGGAALTAIIPDQAGDDAQGTLAIPTTVALVKNPARPEAARELVAYLLSEAAEQVLLDAKFIAAGTRSDAQMKLKAKAMAVDYMEVGKAMPRAIQRATALLEGREP